MEAVFTEALAAVTAVATLGGALFFAATAGAFFEQGERSNMRFSLYAAFGVGLLALFQARYLHG